jgi:hypothetical protein
MNKYPEKVSIKEFESLTPKNKEKYLDNFVYYMKFFKTEVIEEAININIRIIENIIDKAPPLRTKMILYRGVFEDYFFDNKKQNVFFKNNAFVSTTIKKDIAQEFMGFADDGIRCCMKEITALPGTKMIWMEGLTSKIGEYEFLLSSNTTFLIRSHKKIRKYPYGDSNYDLCTTNKMSKIKKNNEDIVYASDVVAL